ncbi:DUF4240 domain-containing protein [Microbacterium sp. PMB16]|uniref:DUF4240 domain-containing protein n=1 Tax=Microbacterium sp. PMB16 TaxID=3120157 RepID=UPI003F4BBC88
MSKRLSPAEMESAAEAANRLGSLGAHGFFGGRISEGYALRVLFRTGRRFEDLVLFQKGPDDTEGIGAPTGGEFEVLSASKFLIPSEEGPVVVEDRVVPIRFEDPIAWVDAVTADIQIESWALDHPPRRLMPDDEFWSMIDLLGGSLDGDALARLSAALEDMPHPEIIRFNDTLAARLHELDHPDNAVRFGAADDAIISADASLYYRCEIIAKGRAWFLEHIDRPRVDKEDVGAEGEVLLGIASDAAMHKLPAPEYPIETGFNKSHWPNAPDPAPDPSTSIPSPGPFSYEIQMARLRLAPWSARRLISWVAYSTTGDGFVREIMGCVMQGSVAAARAEVVPFLKTIIGDEERIHPAVIVHAAGVDGITKGISMARITRRSRLSMQDYIDTYYKGVRPPGAK